VAIFIRDNGIKVKKMVEEGHIKKILMYIMMDNGKIIKNNVTDY
jgi:hypothetical protein